MRSPFLYILAMLFAVDPAQAALTFTPNGNLGTIGMSSAIFLFTPSGGTGPYTFSFVPGKEIPNFRLINAPELPTNANANQKGGLAGIPLTSGVQNGTIRLTDNGVVPAVSVDIAVSFTVSPVDLVGGGPFYYAIGDTVFQKFYPVGGTGPYTYTLSGTLPPGLALSTDATTGAALVSGTISNTANTATISNAAITTNQYNFTITVKDSLNNSLGRGFGMAISAMRLSVGGVPLNGCNNQSACSNQNTISNRNLPNATVGLAYNQQISVLGGTPPYNFSLSFLNALPSTLALSSGGQISGTPTGSNFGGRFTVVVTDSASPSHYMTVRLAIKILPITPVPLAFSTNTIPDAAIGSNNVWEVTATGGLPPYTFDVDPATPLPAGELLLADYEISPDNWDPDPLYLRSKIQTPGTYGFNLRITDSAGNRVTRSFSQNVTQMSMNYVFSSGLLNGPPLSDAVLGTPYARYLIPLGGIPPYTITPINIPAGLTIDNTGLLSGTPLEAGINLPKTFTMTDSASPKHSYTDPGNISIASTTSPGLTLSGGDFGYFQMGSQVTINLAASNSAQTPPVFTVSVVSGTVPPGLRLLTGPDLNNGGNTTIAAQLGGIPSTPGVFTFVYRVTDGLGQVGERKVTLHVSGMAIVNTGFAPGIINTPYSQTIDVRGGTPPYTFSLPSGSLPSGLNFDTTTGTISGTPTSTNSTGITIQVMDSGGDILQRGFTLNVYPISLTGPDVLPNGILNETYSYTFTPSPAGTYTFTATGLPSGLSINSSTGVMSGTVFATGTFVITVTASNNSTGQVDVRTFTMFASSLNTITTIINGLPTAVINIGGVPTAYLGDFVAGTNTVAVLGIGQGGTAPYNIALSPGSANLPPGLALASASTYNGSTNFGRFAIAGVPTTLGLYTFTLRYSDSTGIIEDRVVAMNITSLGLATATPSLAYVNQAYSAQLYGTGGNGPCTFALVDSSLLQGNVLAPGLNLSSTGMLSGTPTSTGSYGSNVQLTCGTQTRRITITVTVNATSDNRRIDFGWGPAPGIATVGRGNFAVLTPTGGTGNHTWTLLTALPSGVQLLTGANLPPGFVPPQAVITGTFPTPGTTNIRLRVDDSTGNFGIREETIIATPMRITPINSPFFGNLSTPPLQVGTPYSFSYGSLNATAPLTFTQDTGTLLPPGITFSSAGVLSGTPTASPNLIPGGNFNLFFHVTDANNNVRYFSTSLSVYQANRAIGVNQQAGLGTLLPSATINQSYSLVLNDLLSFGYGVPPFTWTFYDGTLPPGLSIAPGVGNGSATLAGTPTTAGTFTFSLLATDSKGQQALVKNLQMIVSVFGLSPGAGALPPAIAGTAYNQPSGLPITASGGTGPYTFSLEYDSDLPAGMSLSASGVLSGTPTTAGPFVLYVIAQDAIGNTFRQRYTINVSPVGTVFPSFTLTPSSINITYTKGDPNPAPIPISVDSTAGPLSYTLSTSGGTWLSTSAAGGTTPSSPNLIINPNSPTVLGAATYNAVATFTSSAASNSPANVPVTLTVVNAVVCTYTFNPTQLNNVPSTASDRSFDVIMPSTSCAWAVDTVSLANTAPWIHITSATSGTGTVRATVTFHVDANASNTDRSASIIVNGAAFPVTQFGTACGFEITPTNANAGSGAGNFGVAVTASSSTCRWSATWDIANTWLTFNGSSAYPSSGTLAGNGFVPITIQANAGGVSRTALPTIAGKTYSLTQAAASCTYSLSASTASVSSAGGPVSVNIVAPSACAWTVNPGPSWVQVTSPANLQGIGSPSPGTTISLNILPNSTTSPRQATVQVVNQLMTITQAGVPCSFSMNPNNPTQPAAGGNGSVDINTNTGCNWTAGSNAAFVSPASNNGSGPATLNFSVGPNTTGAPRSANLTIVGQSITVNQDGPVCTYTLQPSSANVPGLGAGGSVGITAAAGCPVSASSNTPDWLHITGSSATSVSYTADPNLTGAARFGTLTVAGQPFSVTQPAAPCTVALNPSSTPAPIDQFGGGGQFTYTTNPAGCVVNVQSFTSWITVTNVSGGTVNFSVAANTYAAPRSGTVMVGDQSFTVNQNASTCAYTLTTFAKTFGPNGGDGAVPMTYQPSQCTPPPVIVNGPVGMVTLGPVIGGIINGLNAYTQNYTVGIYLSFINYVRTTQLLINGQIFTVKQTSY